MIVSKQSKAKQKGTELTVKEIKEMIYKEIQKKQKQVDRPDEGSSKHTGITFSYSSHSQSPVAVIPAALIGGGFYKTK